jgi:hypothetical protein
LEHKIAAWHVNILLYFAKLHCIDVLSDVIQGLGQMSNKTKHRVAVHELARLNKKMNSSWQNSFTQQGCHGKA